MEERPLEPMHPALFLGALLSSVLIIIGATFFMSQCVGLKNISKKWAMPIRDWGAALNQFAIICGEDRVPP
jgi:hypothetical protein